MPTYDLEVPIQADRWSCGYQTLLSRENVLSFLCEKNTVTREEEAGNFECMLAYMDKGNILDVRKEFAC